MMEEPEATRCVRRVLLCMLDVVEDELCLLEAPEVTSCALMLEAVEGGLCLLEVRGGDAPCAVLYAGDSGG